MGIFDVLKGKPSPKKNAEITMEAKKPALSLTKNPALNRKIDLRKNILAVELDKAKITQRQARVVFVLDHSRSMSKLYKNGTVQETLERIFPLALTFDDNGEMEFYLFDTLFKELDTVNASNLDGYTENVIWPNHGKYGATCYAPVIEEITNRYAKKNPSWIPTFVLFITDGNNSDRKQAKEALTIASHYNIFWKFVGIGQEEFTFLKKLDTMTGRFIDNANFVDISDLSRIEDQELYRLLMLEYSDWLKRCRENQLLS